jgi:hypothetical protein
MTTMQATAFRQMERQRAALPDGAPDCAQEDAEIDRLIDPVLVFRLSVIFFAASVIAAAIHAAIA